MTLAFASLPIPPTALKRSYILGQLSDVRTVLGWLDILTELAPRKAANLNPLKPIEVYEALWNHVNDNMFPLYELDLAGAEEVAAMDGASVADYIDQDGIPIEVLGLDSEQYYWNGTSPTLMYCMLFEDGDHNVSATEGNKVLKPHLKRIMPYLEKGLFAKYAYAPRGRAWRAPWDALGHVVDYVRHQTGLNMLDWSHAAIWEGGGFPEWNIDELRGNAAEWKDAKPLWAKIQKFTAYVDANAKERLPLLAGALAGDAAIIQRLTVAAPGKTLAEIFSEEKQKA